MGDREHWAQPSGLLPNGLLPDTAASVTRVLEPERWSIAEERTAELIDCIQPNKPSEERRSAVADYVQRLIAKCFSCQVFTFGSVPLKTYLPDGDIDLTAFSENEGLKDTWANEVRNMLEKEEKSENAEFRVKEVQYIQAEVKLIKCLVENIVVDISFNQLGGLCTLCFLEEVDHLINQNHLFKRSIILIKAWCYYESRILGAHHGLISTYALETLVLYIFHVFNNSFAGPLEVLYRFLEFFSNFDWDKFCLSLWGPVPVCRLPDMTAEPPRKDGGELLLSKLFDACRSVYSVFPGGQENQGQPFMSKHFNVIDPLRTNNNLGRSVSRGNFFRIRSAFAFGATRLARLLDCPKEDLIHEVNLFFMNTWDRHGSRHRPDAPSADLWCLQQLNLDHVNGSENLKHHSSSKKKIEESAGHDSEVDITHNSHGNSSRQGNRPSEKTSRTSNSSTTSRTQNRKNSGNLSTSRVSDQFAKNANSSDNLHSNRGHRSSKPDHTMSEVQSSFQFGRTRSSPELTDTTNEVSRGRHNRVPETGKKPIASSRPDYSRRKKPEVSGTHSARTSNDDSSSLRDSSSHKSLDVAGDPNIGSNNYHDEAGFGSMGEELASVAESMEMHQEQQDLVNMMASSRIHGLASHQVQFPMNLGSQQLPLPMAPSVLAPVGYAQRNLTGMIPTDIPFVQPPWGSHMPLSQGLVASPLSRYFSTIGLASNQEMIESSTENPGLTETNQLEGDHTSWHNQDAVSGRGFGTDNGGFQIMQSDDKQQSTSVGYNFVPLSRVSSSGSSLGRGQHKFAKESRGLVSKDHSDTFQYKYDRGNEVYPTDRYSNLRSLPTSEPSSSRSKTSSESSWDGSSAKVSKSTRERRGRRSTTSVDSSTVYGKVINGWLRDDASVDNSSSQAEDDNKDWIPLSTMHTEMVERSTGSTSVASQHAQSHQNTNYESSHVSVSDSVIPIAPMHVGSGSRQRTMDNSGMVPYAFYLTGPPVPFLTMLPMYNIPETINADRSPTNLDGEGSENSYSNQSDQKFDSLENHDQSDNFNGSKSNRDAAPMEPTEEHKSDILNSDFTSHWQNLQFGRFCQNPRYHGPLIYPSPVMVPPMYLQGHHVPWDGPGRPISANGNLFTQPMNYGPHPVPVSPLQPGSQRPNGVYQRYGDEVPRYRGGTGTYLPNRKVPIRERQFSSIRNHKGNNNYDRNEYRSEREGNWNMSSRQRAPGRGQSRSDKPSSRPDRFAASESRADRSLDFYRHESFPPYQSQNGSFRPPNSIHSNYSMYPMMSLNSNGVASTGPGVPSVVMFYSYDHNVGYGSPSEKLEFGSHRPVNFSGMNEVTQESEGVPASLMHEQQRFKGGSSSHSSPDEPSSPQSQRGI